MSPQRIQRRRTKGWRMPEGAIYVGRPTKFGNPFRPTKYGSRWLVIDDNDVTYEPWRNTRSSALWKCAELFDSDLTYWLGGRIKYQPGLREAIEHLRGHDLACWCPLSEPCHADVLLEVANGDHHVR